MVWTREIWPVDTRSTVDPPCHFGCHGSMSLRTVALVSLTWQTARRSGPERTESVGVESGVE